MTDNIEEQIRRVVANAPTLNDHLAPFRSDIADLQAQLAKAKTNPQRQAIKRKLNKLLRYVSQATAGNKRKKKPSPRKLAIERGAEKKIRWLTRKPDKNRS